MGDDTPAARILVIEDDPRTAELVAAYLRREGYDTAIAADGREGLQRAERERPDLVVLDLMLPELSGWEVCRRLRREADIPILILSASDQEADRIRGLDVGADDYVVKPFSPKEVVARVKAILRRTRRPAVLRCGPVTLDPEKTRVTVEGRTVELTRSEFELLRTLLSRPGRTFSRAELLTCLYPEGGTVVERVVDVHIGELRAKVEPDRTRPAFIETVRGFGYRLAVAGEGEAAP
jgi:DNA-binding response OmpR family regulator